MLFPLSALLLVLIPMFQLTEVLAADLAVCVHRRPGRQSLSP